MELRNILKTGITINTSGTTGDPKSYFQSPEKIKAANRVALAAQEITTSSKIYTVCKMSHAGGLLAQTLPAISIGAEVTIEDFNPYRFTKVIHNYTHTHLAPGHAKAIINTKKFSELNLSHLWVTCGSDPVEWTTIRKFVERGATFMTNWGMTEIGPIAINATYRNVEQLFYAQERNVNGTILGNIYYCDHKIIDGKLYVKGDISIFGNAWYDTKDIVYKNMLGEMFYLGRSND